MTRIIHRCDDTRAKLSVPVLPQQPPACARGYWAQDAADRCDKLFPRQLETLTLLSKGLTNREIAAAMGISVYTVRETLQVVYKKLDVSCMVEAAVLAAKAGIA